MKTYTVRINADCPCCGHSVNFEASGLTATEIVSLDGVHHVEIGPDANLPTREQLNVEWLARLEEYARRCESFGDEEGANFWREKASTYK